MIEPDERLDGENISRPPIPLRRVNPCTSTSAQRQPLRPSTSGALPFFSGTGHVV
ncbi:hypothetical protein B0F90DRAFT_1695439 [Multifurca ochricompacta]|uniref:Uncharacterized protein n=1 Tax=Multifurca ochricompacta TaxID=376703 RepID=A0AAD4M8Z7_9AGAM|nr:hypothetical protein B0F90DRAFT_1695439 [Multifurca ochricompacta]